MKTRVAPDPSHAGAESASSPERAPLWGGTPGTAAEIWSQRCGESASASVNKTQPEVAAGADASSEGATRSQPEASGAGVGFTAAS